MVRCESWSEGIDKIERIYSWPYYPQREKKISKGGCDTCITISVTRFSPLPFLFFYKNIDLRNKARVIVFVAE